MGVAKPETQTSPWSQFPGSPSGTARHDDIYFVDENTGWSVRATGLIHKTTDGGNTWALKLTKTGTHFRCIGFASPTRGFAGNLGVGSYDSAVTDSNVLYQTFDGGDTWKNVPGFAEEGMKGLCAMYILDANHIYGGGRVRGPAYFIKSTDGGANWTIRNLTAMGVMNGIMDIYFKDPLNGFVVGMDPNKFSADCSPPYYGRLAKTTDGGETWTPVLTTDYFLRVSLENVLADPADRICFTTAEPGLILTLFIIKPQMVGTIGSSRRFPCLRSGLHHPVFTYRELDS